MNQGDSEIRTVFEYKKPFPLYPGETLGPIKELPVIERDQAFLLEALRDFIDEEGVQRQAGQEWMLHGPKIYIPRTEVQILKEV